MASPWEKTGMLTSFIFIRNILANVLYDAYGILTEKGKISVSEEGFNSDKGCSSIQNKKINTAPPLKELN